MHKIRPFLLMVTLPFILTKASSAQWVSFLDESSTRLSLSTVPVNDDKEKDIATADLDQNGLADIIIVRKQPFSTPGPFSDVLLLNNGGVLEDQTATFAPEFLTQPTDARDVFILDFDGDGWEDVVIVNTFEQAHKFYRNLALDGQSNWLGLTEESWRIPPMTVSPSQFCAAWGGDVTGDGSPDLYLSNYSTSGIAHDVLLVNNGSGVFTDETISRLGDFRNSAFGTSVEIRDMDNDGDNDIVKISTLNDVSPWNDVGVFLLFNNGSGFFPSYQKIPSNAAYMFTLGDLNADGLTDVYVVDDNQDYVDIATTILPDISVTYNQTFLSDSPRTTSFGGNVKTADVDGDGDLDVGVADIDVDIPGCNRIFALLENEGISSGTLSDPWGSSVEPWHQSTYDFAFLDVNGDGRTDIFFGYCGSYVVMMQENCFDGFIVSSDPPDGAIDARYPHDPSDSSIEFGWDSIDVTLSSSPSCQLMPLDFTVRVTGGTAPIIIDVIVQGVVATVQLDRPIPPGEWTILTHNFSGTSTCLGFLPGDVNNDRTSAVADITRLVDFLNGVIQLEEWQCDVDRSFLCTFPDVLAVIDLFNGAGAFESWIGRTLVPSPCDGLGFGHFGDH